VAGLPELRERIEALSPRYLEGQRLKDVALRHLSELGPWLGSAVGVAGNAASLLLDALVFAVTLALLLKHGRAGCGRLLRVLPIEDAAKDRFVGRVRDVIVGAAQGLFFGALAQGVVATAGFALFGVSYPFLLGTLCAAFSPLPVVGAGLVWIPVAVRLGMTGHALRAALMAAWFLLLINIADHVLRPMYVGKRAGMPAAIAIVGLLGGAAAFGVVGAFIGPVVLAAAAAAFVALLPPEGYDAGS
jgi:predicted PurR-regulated permease PerM